MPTLHMKEPGFKARFTPSSFTNIIQKWQKSLNYTCCGQKLGGDTSIHLESDYEDSADLMSC